MVMVRVVIGRCLFNIWSLLVLLTALPSLCPEFARFRGSLTNSYADQSLYLIIATFSRMEKSPLDIWRNYMPDHSTWGKNRQIGIFLIIA
jgi:hypothetical protein